MSNPQNPWQTFLDFLDKLFGSNPTVRRFVVMSSIVALVVSTLVLYTLIKFFGFRIEGGKPYLGVYESNLSGVVTVEATSGWQNSGIKLEPGDRVHIEVNGRIHLALNHIYNLAQVAKPLIINDISNQELTSLSLSPTLRQDYPFEGLNRKNYFYRNWTGSDGEDYSGSDMLNGCKINPSERWGALLATVIPKEKGIKIPARHDPLDVINRAGIKSSELKLIHDVDDFTVLEGEKGGELYFIVNDAVISPNYGAKECQRFYQALLSKANSLRDKYHALDEASIPLIWFADNVGSFRITISRIP